MSGVEQYATGIIEDWRPALLHRTIFRSTTSAARCQLFELDSISDLSNSIFDTIGVARTSQEYHRRFHRTDEKTILHKFHQIVIQYLKNQANFWRVPHSISIFDVIRCWFKHCS